MGDGQAVDETSTAAASPAVVDATNHRSTDPTIRSTSLLPLHLAVVTFWLAYWTVDIVSPALPVMQDGLGLSDTAAGLVFSAFFAGRLVANLPAAVLVDRIGARWTGAVGAGLLLGGSVGTALAGGAALLLPARGVQGTGVSLLVAAALLSTLRAQPAGGAAMTTFNLAAGVGGASGLISGGLLAGTLGWRSIFWLSALLAAVMIGGALLAGRGRRPADRRDARRQAVPLVSSPAGAASAVSRRELGLALAANLLVYVNYSIFIVSLPLLADHRFDASAERIGTLLLVTNVAHLIAAVPSGRLVRRWGSERAAAAGFLVTAAGIGAALLAPQVGWLVVPLAVYSVGQVCANTAAGDRLLRLGGQGGRAIGLVRLSSDVGLVIGPAAVGALADLLGVAAPFAVLAVLTAGFALLLWRAAKIEGRTTGSV